MRWTSAVALVPLLCASACFQDPPPVEETTTSSGSDTGCVDGTEGCPCIEGACIGQLACLSNVCVDPGTGTSGTSSSTGNGPTSDSMGDSTDIGDSVDSGPPVTSDSSGELPPGAPCDPVYDLCAPEVTCNGLGRDNVFYCEFPGPVGQGEICNGPLECGDHLYCVSGEAFDNCDASAGCCTTFCDIFDPDPALWCNEGFFCEPFFIEGLAPPGYEHVGVCVQSPS